MENTDRISIDNSGVDASDNQKDFSIEKAFDELAGIISRMEEDQLSLAESMDLYKKGVGLLSRCRETLDTTEKELIVLQGDQDEITGQNQPSE